MVGPAEVREMVKESPQQLEQQLGPQWERQRVPRERRPLRQGQERGLIQEQEQEQR